MLVSLFLTFTKVGLFTFGGGYAMIAFIESICVEEKKWISHEDMMDVSVIAESTPGPIAINAATYVGYKQAGLKGAIAATLGIITPSFLIIYIISLFLDNYMEIELVAHAFYGIRIGVAILIMDAAIKMIKKMPNKNIPRIIMVFSFLMMLVILTTSLPISSLTLMLSAGFISLLIYLITSKAGERV